MTAKQLRIITKSYPPQFTATQQQIYLYNPLEHWLEVHDQTSLIDVVEIDGPHQPYYLNQCSEDVFLQSEKSLWSYCREGE